jgi:hypothetical protein
MTMSDPGDPIFRILARLPADAPAAASAERVRARCHAALIKRRQRTERPHHGHLVARVVNVGLVAALCTYLAQAASEALRLARNTIP